MTTSLPPDFTIDGPEPASQPDDPITRQTKFVARLSTLREQFNEYMRLHDEATEPIDRRRYLASLAAIRRRMIWYEARIPGAQLPGDGKRPPTRLSDQIISLDPILSRLP